MSHYALRRRAIIRKHRKGVPLCPEKTGNNKEREEKAMSGYKYRESHEWVKFEDETTALIGISNYAQESLGDIVFVNLPSVGDPVTAGETFADVESVKAVSDIYSPVNGVVAEVNEALCDRPEAINEDALAAWFIKVEKVTETEELMDEDAYGQFVAGLE